MIETTKDMISVWMGTSFKTPDEFNEYTDGMEDSDSHCPAFADFGVSFIDSDYFVAFQTDNGEIVPVEVLAEEVGAHSNKVVKVIIKIANNLVHLFNKITELLLYTIAPIITKRRLAIPIRWKK